MKRLFNFDCPKCGPVELLAKSNINTRRCYCGEVVSKSKKPNSIKGRIIQGCDNNKSPG